MIIHLFVLCIIIIGTKERWHLPHPQVRVALRALMKTCLVHIKGGPWQLRGQVVGGRGMWN